MEARGIFIYVCISTEIGVGLTACGLLFTMLGVVLFFDGALLAVGNVSARSLPSVVEYICLSLFSMQLLFLGGVFLILGLSRTKSFFFQKQKLRGTALFFSGILLVIVKWWVPQRRIWFLALCCCWREKNAKANFT
jgi:hypothetical protein